MIKLYIHSYKHQSNNNTYTNDVTDWKVVITITIMMKL